MRSISVKWIFRFRTFVRQSYSILYLYYSMDDHGLFYQHHGAWEFSELIYCQVIIQKIVFRILYGYSKFLILLFRVINFQRSKLIIIAFIYLFVISLLDFLYLWNFDLLSMTEIRQNIYNLITGSSSRTSSCHAEQVGVLDRYYHILRPSLFERSNLH